tara:strand:+ start:292 stop:510 length:219 start_codon:yes stop_codon:yes gene_type:complete
MKPEAAAVLGIVQLVKTKERQIAEVRVQFAAQSVVTRLQKNLLALNPQTSFHVLSTALCSLHAPTLKTEMSM